MAAAATLRGTSCGAAQAPLSGALSGQVVTWHFHSCLHLQQLLSNQINELLSTFFNLLQAFLMKGMIQVRTLKLLSESSQLAAVFLCYSSHNTKCVNEQVRKAHVLVTSTPSSPQLAPIEVKDKHKFRLLLEITPVRT